MAVTPVQMGGTPDVAAYQRELAAVWQKCVLQLHSIAVLTPVGCRYDCHPGKSVAPLLAQGPLFICLFLAIKRMALLPSFETGGAAWFTNLAVADPLYIMPLLSGATFLATVEVCAWRVLAHTPGSDRWHAPASWAQRMACRATRLQKTSSRDCAS